MPRTLKLKETLAASSHFQVAERPFRWLVGLRERDREEAGLTSHEQVNLEGKKTPEIQLSSPKSLDSDSEQSPSLTQCAGNFKLFTPSTEDLLIFASLYFPFFVILPLSLPPSLGTTLSPPCPSVSLWRFPLVRTPKTPYYFLPGSLWG